MQSPRRRRALNPALICSRLSLTAAASSDGLICDQDTNTAEHPVLIAHISAAQLARLAQLALYPSPPLPPLRFPPSKTNLPLDGPSPTNPDVSGAAVEDVLDAVRWHHARNGRPSRSHHISAPQRKSALAVHCSQSHGLRGHQHRESGVVSLAGRVSAATQIEIAGLLAFVLKSYVDFWIILALLMTNATLGALLCCPFILCRLSLSCPLSIQTSYLLPLSMVIPIPTVHPSTAT